MRLILPDGSEMPCHLHGTRDRSMTHAVVSRINPELVPGHRWGLHTLHATEAKAEAKAASVRKKSPAYEVRVVRVVD